MGWGTSILVYRCRLILGLTALTALAAPAASSASTIVWSRYDKNFTRQQIVAARPDGSRLDAISMQEGRFHIDAQISSNGRRVARAGLSSATPPSTLAAQRRRPSDLVTTPARSPRGDLRELRGLRPRANRRLGRGFRMDADGGNVRRLTPWRLEADIPDLSLRGERTWSSSRPTGTAKPGLSSRPSRRPVARGQVPQADSLRDAPPRRAGLELQPELLAERPPDRLHALLSRRQAHTVRRRYLDDGSQRPP